MRFCWFMGGEKVFGGERVSGEKRLVLLRRYHPNFWCEGNASGRKEPLSISPGFIFLFLIDALPMDDDSKTQFRFYYARSGML